MKRIAINKKFINNFIYIFLIKIYLINNFKYFNNKIGKCIYKLKIIYFLYFYFNLY